MGASSVTHKRLVKTVGAGLIGLPFLIVLIAIAVESPDPSVVVRGYAIGAGMAAAICLGVWLVTRDQN